MASKSIIRGFAVAVRQYRNQCGLTQEGLAFEAGMHRNFISGLERGLKNPSLVTIESLAKAFGIAPSELVGRAERVK